MSTKSNKSKPKSTLIEENKRLAEENRRVYATNRALQLQVQEYAEALEAAQSDIVQLTQLLQARGIQRPRGSYQLLKNRILRLEEQLRQSQNEAGRLESQLHEETAKRQELERRCLAAEGRLVTLLPQPAA